MYRLTDTQATFRRISSRESQPTRKRHLSSPARVETELKRRKVEVEQGLDVTKLIILVQYSDLNQVRTDKYHGRKVNQTVTVSALPSIM